MANGSPVKQSRLRAPNAHAPRRSAVMPSRFRFPMNQRLWIPLRTGSTDVFVFARLVPGATLEGAHVDHPDFRVVERFSPRSGRTRFGVW